MGAVSKIVLFIMVVAVFAWPGYETVVSVVAHLDDDPDSPSRKVSNPTVRPAPTRPRPTSIPASTKIAQAASSVIARAAAIVQRDPTATPLPTAIPAPTPTRPPEPTPTAVPPPHALMLELINGARTDAGLARVELGENRAAQIHAENSLRDCTASHWGIDGLKPYMRYSLAGGYQSNAENWYGSDYCITEADGYRAIETVSMEIGRAMQGWMESPGHRANILDPSHKKVNMGMAWDRFNFVAYQHFEGDYVEFTDLPRIEGGRLSFEGRVKNGAAFGVDSIFPVRIGFDPTPHPLARGQVAMTYCYGPGVPVLYLRELLPLINQLPEEYVLEEYLPDEPINTEHESCTDPYAISPDAPAPSSHEEAHLFWQRARSLNQQPVRVPVSVPTRTASRWQMSGDSFSVAADVSDILWTHGPGVYTIELLGILAGEPEVISTYSVFHQVPRPQGYGP